MILKKSLLSVSLLLLAAAPSLAAGTQLGRISYIYPDGRHLILDSQKEFALAPGVSLEKHGVAEFVRLTIGVNNQVTNIAPGPANLAGYWAPPPGQSS